MSIGTTETKSTTFDAQLHQESLQILAGMVGNSNFAFSSCDLKIMVDAAVDAALFLRERIANGTID